MQFTHQGFKGNYGGFSGTVSCLGNKIKSFLIAPAVQPQFSLRLFWAGGNQLYRLQRWVPGLRFLREHAFVIFITGHQFYCRNAQFLQVRDFFDNALEGTPVLYAGAFVHGKCTDIQAIDHAL